MDEDDEDDDDNQPALELVVFIQEAGGVTVRTLTSLHEIPAPPGPNDDSDDDVIIDVPVSASFDGRDEAGALLPDGTYSYLALGNLINVDATEDPDGEEGNNDDDDDGDHKGKRVLATAFPVVGDILLDGTDPVITADVNPQPNDNGWNNTVPVTAGFGCSDNLSGVDTVTPSRTFQTEILALELVGECTDRAGNRATTSVTSSGPHHQDSGEAKIRESTAGVSRKPSSDGKACGCSSKHLCGLTAWNT